MCTLMRKPLQAG